MSDDKDIPQRASWLERLENSVSRYTDPIERLSQHLLPQRDHYTVEYSEDQGSLYFEAPPEWKKDHPFNVPTGILHCEGGGRPFSNDVEDGLAIVYWLTPQALMKKVPLEHAREVLWKRAESFCTSLRDRLEIEPLEFSLYFPQGKFRDAIAGEPYNACAALILATNKKNKSKLANEGTKLISMAQVTRAVLNENDEDRTPSPPPVQGLDILHRLTQSTEYSCDEVLDELGTHLHGTAQVIARNRKGHFVLPMLDTGNPDDARFTDADLGLTLDTDHVLAIPLDTDYFINPPREDSKVGGAKPKPLNAQAQQQNTERLRYLLKELGDTIHCRFEGTYLYDTESDAPPVLVLSTDAPHCDEVLQDLADTIGSYHASTKEKDNEWRSYCDDRAIEHRPPSR